MYILYHICYSKDVGNYEVGYVGMTRNSASKRLGQHLHNKNLRNLDFRDALDNRFDELVAYDICYGTYEDIKRREFNLRPEPSMGWNFNPGGGGKNQKKESNLEVLKVNKLELHGSKDSNVIRSIEGHKTRRLSHPTYNQEVIQMDMKGRVIKKWASVFEASDSLFIPAGEIGKSVSGKRKSARGFKWYQEYKIRKEGYIKYRK